MNPDKKSYKTSLCRHFTTKGYCSLYDKCHFAHGKQELRSRVDPIPATVPPPVTPISIYKTQLCKYFMNGYCRNSINCPFAHGPYDLHSIVVTPVNTIDNNQPQPDYGNAGEFLVSILRSLEQVFDCNDDKKQLINKGIELVKENALPQADQIITQIVKSKSLTEQEKDKCQTILQNAYALHKISFKPF